MDIAPPTVLALLQVGHAEPFVGREAVSAIYNEPHAFLETMLNRLERLALRRGPVLRVLILLQISLYSASLLALIINRPPARLLRALQFCT